MSQETTGTSVEIMGKSYQIKCPEEEINSLHRAAKYLEEKMLLLRESGVFSLDRMAVITALNVVHQLLTLEQQRKLDVQMLNQRIHILHSKLDIALAETKQLEFAESD